MDYGYGGEKEGGGSGYDYGGGGGYPQRDVRQPKAIGGGIPGWTGRGNRTQNYNQQGQGSSYKKKARELGAKQKYEHLQRLEAQRQAQEVQQRRINERELRRQEAKQQKVKGRFTRRFGKRAWRKREKKGRNF